MSNTDLYGKRIGEPAEFHLSKWQKRQATLLYHFASLEYLKGLKKLLDDFVKSVDITLDDAQRQDRDQLLVSERWGVRNTVANFSTYGFPALQDFQKATSKDIALRATESFEFTGYNQCTRLLAELSMNWSTPDEEARFEAGMAAIGKCAGLIDSTMERSWNDGSFANVWKQLSKQFSRLPRFRVRTDVEGATGNRPVRTGVYVPQDDPYGALQFAWSGNSGGRLLDCKTFNALGLQAVNTLGRDAIWSDDPRLLQIVKQPNYIAGFKELDWFKEPGFLNDATRATAFVGGSGFIGRSCKWYFVEQIEGEGEYDAEQTEGVDATGPTAVRARAEAGSLCPRDGFWFTPAQANSRRFFRASEVMPEIGGDYGATIWQWDQNQSQSMT